MDTPRRLPLGYANFAKIRAQNRIFADKTRLIYELITEDTPFFLSRPRRFGKTLLVSVLKAIFEGRKDLFKGLWIYDQEYDWAPHPVIRLSLATAQNDTPEDLKNSLNYKLNLIASKEKIKLEPGAPADLFLALVQGLNLKYGESVAILIDEYDAPILAHLDNTDLAVKIRKTLKDFYGALKDCEDERCFVFITGVSKFAKTSLFSGLNNLTDLTLEKKFANILGFTIEEFDHLFKEHMEETLNEFISANSIEAIKTVADLKAKILGWYDGYSWDGKSSVLNPWAVLTFFRKREFDNYWLETGHPGFLENMIKTGQITISDIFHKNFFTNSMNVIDIGAKLNLKALLFQTGYLTVARTEFTDEGAYYFLNFPNLEVKTSIAQLCLSLEDPIKKPLLLVTQGKAILETLINRDADGFRLAFQSFISNLSCRVFTYNENFYSMMFTLAIIFSGQLCEPQKEVAGGVMDLHFRSRYGDDFVIEFKYVPLPSTEDDNYESRKKELMEKARDKAFEQIERKRYYFCFQGGGNKIFKTALIFGGRSEILVDFQEARNWILEWDEKSRVYAVKET
ncbi:MAG: ATP-binding protein [Deltaproteobacteria bacterium]|jgi:hypothetical protein|nr:ATP-binding protein [Deltaproteobacteria bacterium]